ncbi:glyoxalase/Bleomycin resistance protein/Dioxygenase superfamily domain-containing protein [Ditylenchus destructor]|uniref:4-hydroxyphenylpyruvate dioxygenase n=1 Tax=Ditylenchus destructor TaxID=166010 RepID=A0AAD4N8G6_9BILA|nr:glyoxalase/Bleomycin resistance protein/Dioxygenase superfamily domain-containing protein [Ditylenchus destructor]
MIIDAVNSYHHVQFYVSNALQSSFWYCINFGFERFAIKRCKRFSQVAIRNGSIVMVFKCALNPDDAEISKQLSRHGDFVKDVSFRVDDVVSLVESIQQFGNRIIRPVERIEDEFGSVIVATIQGSAGSIVHTLIQNIDYKGLFFPGFRPIGNFTICPTLSTIRLIDMDHVVEGHPENTVDNVIDWYNQTLKMDRFWSIDDRLVHTKYSALKAILVGNAKRNVKMTLVEPVTVVGGRRGQVQEFVDHHGGSGIQHIAFTTDDIIDVIGKMRERGVEFLDIPDSYYDLLEMRLSNSKIIVKEELKNIRKLKILLDFDDNGYLLQIFTKPMQDRPTLFIEIIRRHNYDGFGAGNFAALFAAVELEQKNRDRMCSQNITIS